MNDGKQYAEDDERDKDAQKGACSVVQEVVTTDATPGTKSAGVRMIRQYIDA